MLRPRRPLLPSNNLPSPATLFRCSFIAPPSSRIRATTTYSGQFLLSWPEEWATRSQTRFRFTCPLCISAGHAAFALSAYFASFAGHRSHRISRFHRVYAMDWRLFFLASEVRIDFVKENSFQTFLDRIYFRVFLQKMDRIYTFTPSWFFSVGKDFYPSSF